jgi:hypothetical protein
MALPELIRHNWLSLFQTASIAAGFVFIAVAILFDARARRATNLIRLTEQHRELWERMYVEPDLARIFDADADPESKGLTAHEETFVIFIVLHLSTTYYAIRSGLIRNTRGLRNDIQRFFSLPIPRTVWERIKHLQDPPFVQFVERCFTSPDLSVRP